MAFTPSPQPQTPVSPPPGQPAGPRPTTPLGSEPPRPPLSVTIFGATNQGKVRQENQDKVLFFTPDDTRQRQEQGILALVADGMGGRQSGAIASDIAATEIKQAYYYAGSPNPLEALHQAVWRANQAVYALGTRPDSKWVNSGMGTTVTAVVILGNTLYLAHVGDSRAYLIRNGQITQLSEDHTWVREALAARRISPAEARTHPNRHVITRSLGNQPEVTPYLRQETLADGDLLVLCTDGLTDLVPDDEIMRVVVSQARGQPERAVRRLIDLANRRGGHDNITVLVARMGAGKMAALPGGGRMNTGLLWGAALAVLLAAVCGPVSVGGVWLATQLPGPGSPAAVSTRPPVMTDIPTVTPSPTGPGTPLRTSTPVTLTPTFTPSPTRTPTHTPTATLTTTPTPTPSETPKSGGGNGGAQPSPTSRREIGTCMRRS